MKPRSRVRFGWACVLAVGLLAVAAIASGQQDPPKKRKVEKRRPAPEPPQKKEPKGKRRVEKHRPRVEPDRQAPPARRRDADSHDRRRVTPRRGKVYLPTRRAYGHIRVSERPHRHDGSIQVGRIIARSQRVTPIVLERFEDRRRDEISVIIRYYREHDHAHAIEAWGRFIDGLADHRLAIDLDELMMYIAREGCRHGSDELAYHGRRLHYLQDWQDLLLDYLADVRRQHDECMSPAHECSERTIHSIDRDLARARADLDVARVEEQLARDQFETRLHSAGDYEERFGSIYEEIYRSVEVRIIVSD